MENLLDRVIAERDNVGEALDRQVHVFWEAQAWDLDFDSLDVGMLSADADVKSKVAEALGTHALKLSAFRVERNQETESITLTPPAQFGLTPVL